MALTLLALPNSVIPRKQQHFVLDVSSFLRTKQRSDAYSDGRKPPWVPQTVRCTTHSSKHLETTVLDTWISQAVSIHINRRKIALTTWNGLVPQVCRLNYCWPSPAQLFLASGLVEIYDQDSCSLLDMYVLRNGPPLRREEGSVFLTDWLTAKLLLALASIVILGFRSRRDLWPRFLFSPRQVRV
jgi:hypothetical protein